MTPTGCGGASGSPIGGGGTGPFPGTSGTDFYACKGFNGENLDETALASKFSNNIRWPGETIISTSRCAKTIAGTASGFPTNCYAVTSYGGNGFMYPCHCNCCRECLNAGCGGGSGGGNSYGSCICYCNYGYGVTCNIQCSRHCSGDSGAGFVVIEY